MDRLASIVLGNRKWVALMWALLFAAGLAVAGPTANKLTLDFSLPGQPGDTADKQLLQDYGVSSFDTLLPVVTVPEGTTVQAESAKVAGVYDAVREAVPGIRLVDAASTGDDRFVTDDGRTTFALVQGPFPEGFGSGIEVQLEPALEQAASAAGFESSLTSYNLLSAGGGENEGPSVLIETLLGALGALAVLAFVFASFLAFVPLLIAAVSILTTFLLVFGLTYLTDVSFVAQFLISLIGLGVAIDYSLLVVSRWREERERGLENQEAVRVAIRTAGHAVLASGVTVAISLVALVVLPVPFLRSMGLAGMLIPLVSVAVSLTLLPVLLSSIGPKIDWPRIRHEAVASRGWTAWARAIVKRRFLAVGVAGAVLAVLIAPVFGLKIGQSGSDSLARGGPAYEALQQLRDGGVDTGVLTPIDVLVPTASVDAVITATRDLEGVRTAASSSVASGRAVVDVIPVRETVDSSGTAVVDRVREAAREAVASSGGDAGSVVVAGTGAAVQDYRSAVYDKFPYVLLLISVVTFILLVRTFRSLILPIKAVLLNLLSLGAVFGTVVFFWQSGNGSDAVFGVDPTGAVTFWLPILIFAFLFGLSMDYEVFILARMREEFDATGSTDTAVITGIGRTGRLVTSAALILFFAFAALASAPGTDIKVLGTALGVGILIDATIVRALLVPALVTAFGRYNWWLPAGLAKVLFVEPSPLPPPEPRATGRTPVPAEV